MLYCEYCDTSLATLTTPSMTIMWCDNYMCPEYDNYEHWVSHEGTWTHANA